MVESAPIAGEPIVLRADGLESVPRLGHAHGELAAPAREPMRLDRVGRWATRRWYWPVGVMANMDVTIAPAARIQVGKSPQFHECLL